MGFFSGLVSKVTSAVKSVFSAAKSAVSAAEKAITTGLSKDINNAITQIDNTINEVDKLIKLLEGPKKQKITTGAEDSGILPTWDEIKARWNNAVNCDLKIASDTIRNAFNELGNEVSNKYNEIKNDVINEYTYFSNELNNSLGLAYQGTDEAGKA
ncbi:hypothetical protein I6U48_29370 [Clostridium sp. PL3]|uniref:Uncharacterized protein n=1 Tax=Clostridium thailandense TaxID=2794346 RepID=A0A949WU62_9CLOT|nr:hypothetical protein [Clostridium thailandense]MBV7276981.1 hypothetical protein [Clostridium thailandense]